MSRLKRFLRAVPIMIGLLAMAVSYSAIVLAVTTYPRIGLQAPDVADTPYTPTIKTTVQKIDTDGCFNDVSCRLPSIKCVTLEAVTGADDNFEFWIAPPAGAIVDAATCHCNQNCDAPTPTLTFEKRTGTGIVTIPITGTPLACSLGESTVSTFSDFTSQNTLTSGQGVRFDVTNTPGGSARITVCVTYR